MGLTEFTDVMLPAVEAELNKQISRLDEPRIQLLREMLLYHMGWSGEGSGVEAQGKRIRPLLLLLTCASCDGDWKTGLPAAAAVELVHNFSLVHDDIQDNSSKRRGRDTIWIKWGMPQGINAGDALFVLSNQAILDLELHVPPATVIRAAKFLHDTCLDLTRGQYLDMSYENRADVTIKDYWPMISYKTASLLSTSCLIGSLLGNADQATQDAYRDFGHYLGLAFQVQDDILGIWGDTMLVGKPVDSDLISRKKSLPILYGLEKKGLFAQRWSGEEIKPEDIAGLADQLAVEGGRLFAQESADQMTDLALLALRTADPKGHAGEALHDLFSKLLSREA